MRAIDADELIKFPHSESAGTDEQIENWIEECGLSDEGVIDRAKKLCWAVIDGFINLIKTEPTLTPPNEWASVDERLPEPGERVLATDCGFVGEFYINKRGKWQRYNVNCSELLMALDILYWMPLPAPPGKDNNVPAKAPNEPLTQADLDSMDYDKVWIDYEDGTGEWALVCRGYIYSIDTLEGAGFDFVDYMRGERLEPHGYKVYRRPPEGEEAT